MTTHATPIVLTGLCSTCTRAPGCALTHPSLGVWSCDDFAPAATEVTQVLLPTPETEAVPQGICVDCAFRDACELAPTVGGIWACEEYR